MIALLTLVSAADLILTDSKSARGVTIAGIDAGNHTSAGLEPVLDQLSARARLPVIVTTDAGTAQFSPAQLGLTFDVEATRSRLLEQPRNPLSRLAALAGREHSVDPVVGVDPAALDTALDSAREVLESAAVEGGVHYQGTSPVAQQSSGGMRVARVGAADALRVAWLTGNPVALPMEPFSPTVDAATVAATVRGPAARATAASLTLVGRHGVRTELSVGQIATLLSFVADGKGGLVPTIGEPAAREVLEPTLKKSQSEPVGARFSVSGGTPKVIASVDGARIDWPATLRAVAQRLVADDGPRRVEVAYHRVPPTLTTAAARRLGVRELVSEYTTGGFSDASGENIRLVAAEVDGAIVMPGKVFSLNGHTGPRGAAQGYVTSTIIDHGRAAKAVGGGISQFATTLYNAAYFAGLEDVDHTEHSYYISRYPEAREATVFDGAIDLKFRNNTRYGILVEASWSSSSITVRMWSTQTVDVESVTGERTAPTTPPKLRFPKGDDCIASNGSNGFTTSNTRIIRDHRSGAEIGRHTRTVRYEPEPKVICG